MNDGEHKLVSDHYETRLVPLREQIYQIEQQRMVAISKLQEDCIRHYGKHKASKGESFCIRCGAIIE